MSRRKNVMNVNYVTNVIKVGEDGKKGYGII